jgi:hypothetical protein
MTAQQIVAAARAEGFGPTLTAFEAAQLGLQYGVWVHTGPIGGYRLQDVAVEIAQKIERKR